MTSRTVRPTAGQLAVAAMSLVVALGGAFLAASLTQDRPIFRLTPPPAKSAPDVQLPPDIDESERLDLHRTFFTAWAALILVAPAFCTFLFRRSSESAAGYWLAFWTVGLVAFLVHFYWAVSVIFGYDWDTIFHKTTRVSAALPDVVFAAWWALDVLLAWLLRSEGFLVRAQRFLVHLLGFALFFAGAALEGELRLSRALGWALCASVLLSVAVWVFRRLKRRDLAVAHAA